MRPPRAGQLFARLRWMRVIAAAAFTVLIVRLGHIQFVRGAELRDLARNNRFAEHEIAADRGVIYDSQGRQVVFNRPQFTISIVPAALPEDPRALAAVLARVGAALDLPVAARPSPARAAEGAADTPAPTGGDGRPSLESFLYEDGRLVRTWSRIPIPRTLAREHAFELMEDAIQLPGVVIGESSVREYATGPALAHILGFTGSIPEDEIDAYRADDYAIYDVVGRTGVEYTYEDVLRGRKGRKVVMVDAMGHPLADISQPLDPEPGHALRLTLDVKFQQQAEAALQHGLDRIGARSGAVVAIDPRDGAIRALVSLPTYDNNMFSTGASPAEFAELLANPDKPLLNRAISGQFAPGSTFKLITAAAALQEGVIDASTRIVDPGVIYLPNQYNPEIRYPFVCWHRGGHGALDIVGAIANSCDVFFYEISGGNAPGRREIAGLGSARLERYARLFGLGEASQVDLLGEAAGRVPTPAWLKDWFDLFWGTGQTYITGIGQGYSLVTPIQMANVTAAVANGGVLYRPHVVEAVNDTTGAPVPVTLPDGTRLGKPGGVLRRLPIDGSHLALIRQGMAAAVRSGTAQPAWTHLPTEVRVAGKTGTAEFCDPIRIDDGTPEGKADCRRDRDGYLLTHAWFVAFAPVEQPEIALAVFVDGSGLSRIIEGSREAAPIAADVLRAYFGLPERRPTATAAGTPCDGCPATPSTAPAAPAEAGR